MTIIVFLVLNQFYFTEYNFTIRNIIQVLLITVNMYWKCFAEKYYKW